MSNILIVGGGNSAYSLISFLTKDENSIMLYTSKPELWSKEIVTEIRNENDEVIDKVPGKLDLISNSFEELVPLADILTPTIKKDGINQINPTYRFFMDDVYYGMMIAKWFAQDLNIETPVIDKILRWAEKLLNDKLMDEEGNLIPRTPDSSYKYGTPDVYGYTSVAQLVD